MDSRTNCNLNKVLVSLSLITRYWVLATLSLVAKGASVIKGCAKDERNY